MKFDYFQQGILVSIAVFLMIYFWNNTIK